MTTPKLTQDYLKTLLDYDPVKGIFIWKERGYEGPARAWDVRYANKKAGTIDHEGYVQLKVDEKTYRGSKLAWLMYYGKWPKHKVKHLNGKRDDIRINNLGILIGN